MEESVSFNEIGATKGGKSEEDTILNGTNEAFGFPPLNTSRRERGAKNLRMNRNHSSREHITKLSDERLEKMSIQDFNKQLRHLPEGILQSYRKRRRILKNRKYALKCRRKCWEERNNIAEQNRALKREIFRTKEDLRKVTKERDDYKDKYICLTFQQCSASCKTHQHMVTSRSKDLLAESQST